MGHTTQEGVQGICPNGWHIPSDDEYVTLVTSQGGFTVAGGKMKSTGTVQAGTGLWLSPNTGATNSSGFTAHPGGLRSPHSIDTYSYISETGYFWSSTEFNTTQAWFYDMYYEAASVLRAELIKTYGFSVRCVLD